MGLHLLDYFPIFTKNSSTTQWILLILLFFFVQSSFCTFLYKESEACNDTAGNPLNCPHNMVYYFECCAHECCLRTQIFPAILIGSIALIMTIFCIISCIAYCCCSE